MTIQAVSMGANDQCYDSKLTELGESLKKARQSLSDRAMSFWRRETKEEKAARSEMTTKVVRDIASYLSFAKAKSEVTHTINELVELIIAKKMPLDSEDRALLERERLAMRLRDNPEKIHIKNVFRSQINKELLSKWTKAGFPEEAFFWNPTIAPFIFQGHIHNKMKVYGETFEYDAVTHEFKILVDGKLQDVAEIAERVQAKETSFFGHKSTELVSKENASEKWNYLPQKGLTVWNDFGWEELSPFASLSENEVAFAQSHALRKDGSKGQKGDYVVEILGTIQDYKEYPFVSGYQETFTKYRHAWIRMIAPDGKFYSLGFLRGGVIKPEQLAAMVKGLFRTPDPWETMPYEKLAITGFALNEEDCNVFKAKIQTLQKQEIGFNFIESNCSAFVSWVKDQLAPTREAGDTVSFAADISELVKICLPKTVQTIGKKLSPLWNVVVYYCSEFSPPIMKRIASCALAAIRLIAERTLLAISGRWFSYNKEKEFPKNDDPHKGIPWWKVMQHINIALEQKLVKVYLPRKVAEWQLAQPQTRVIKANTPLFSQYQEA
jgi:hypothetical protein